MLLRIAAFEFRYQVRGPLFPASVIALFLLAIAGMVSDDLAFSTRSQVHENAPVSLAGAHAVLSILFLFVPAAFVSNVVIRDQQTAFGPLVWATAILKFDYLLGRFAGATAAAAGALLALPVGMWLGTLAPGIAPETLGPNHLSHFAFGYLLMALPNALLGSAVFFALATITRSTLGTFVGLIALVLIHSASAALSQALGSRELLAVADPFGMAALNEVTRYWTVEQSNAQLPPLSGILLWNRVAWATVAFALIALAYAVFDLRGAGRRARKVRRGSDEGIPVRELSKQPHRTALPAPRFDRRTARAQLFVRTRFELRQVFRSPAFPALILPGLVASVALLSTAGALYGTPPLPVTRHMVVWLSAVFNVVSLIVAVYFAGELVWRDRDHRFHLILDATALPSWGHVVPKVLATYLVLLTTLLAGVVAAVGVQLSHGFGGVELLPYLLWYVLPASVDTMLIAVLAVFVQAVSPSKAVGWGVMLLYFVGVTAAGTARLDGHLYLYGQTPAVPFSDMNGLGSFWKEAWLFRLYWTACAVLLALAAYLLWPRGAETLLLPRLRRVPSRLRGKAGVIAAIAFGVFVCAGAISLRASVPMEKTDDREAFLAEYERRYVKHLGLPQPSIEAVALDVELYPRERRALARGRFSLRNLTGQPLKEVHVRRPEPDLEITSLELEGARLVEHDEAFGYRVYALEPPILPGEMRELRFATLRSARGLEDLRLVENGTFLDSRALLPAIGMSRSGFLKDPATRREQGLPPSAGTPSLEARGSSTRNALGADWATADITVSTDEDQTPIAPGERLSERVESGRRIARFMSRSPILTVFSIQSARYAEEHSRAEGVDLAVYFHPQHPWNVGTMLDALESSVAYCRDAFGPSPFKEIRITEFPAYALAAQTFANTIPYSEAAGFVADLRGGDGVDYVTYLTAHEVAHQWWGHQVIGADVQGSSMLTETLAQYSALMVMRKLHGEHEVRQFLRFELDGYLLARGTGGVGELPLARVENQPYIHYQKGALAMYLLQERLGEQQVNRALSRYLERYRHSSAAYPRSTDLIALLREEATTAEEQALITDLFERITLYDLSVSEPTAERRSDGGWVVSLAVHVRKFYAEGDGKESEAPVTEEIEVGLFTADPQSPSFRQGNVMVFERRPVRSGSQVLQFVTRERPTHVGIDPYRYFIDRNTADNVATLGR